MVSTTPGASPAIPAARPWVIVARLITLLIFLQPFFIGLMFSGRANALEMHSANAYAIFLLTLGGLIVAAIIRRKDPAGRHMISEFLHMLVGVIIVAVLGVLSHEGIIRIHWLHFPMGMALLMPAMSLVSAAEGLYRPADSD